MDINKAKEQLIWKAIGTHTDTGALGRKKRKFLEFYSETGLYDKAYFSNVYTKMLDSKNIIDKNLMADLFPDIEMFQDIKNSNNQLLLCAGGDKNILPDTSVKKYFKYYTHSEIHIPNGYVWCDSRSTKIPLGANRYANGTLIYNMALTAEIESLPAAQFWDIVFKYMVVSEGYVWKEKSFKDTVKGALPMIIGAYTSGSTTDSTTSQSYGTGLLYALAKNMAISYVTNKLIEHYYDTDAYDTDAYDTTESNKDSISASFLDNNFYENYDLKYENYDLKYENYDLKYK
jgi:hypothetical protein